MRTLTLFLSTACITCLGCSKPQPAIDRAAEIEPAKTAPSERGERRHAVAGPMGQPPLELKSFRAPIELIAGNGYLDGGTTFVLLRDADGVELLFCVNQDSFESDEAPAVPGGALLIGGTNTLESAARLPFNQDEAKLVVQSLQLALNSIAERYPEYCEEAEEGDKPAPAWQRIKRSKITNREHLFSLGFATQAMRKLHARTEPFPLADRAEVAARTARLETIDIDVLAREFREKAGESRDEIWEQLEPAIRGALRKEEDKTTIARRLKDWLGEPEADALASKRTMVTFKDSTPIENDVFAYSLGESKYGLYQTLILDFRHGGLAYSVIGGTSP